MAIQALKQTIAHLTTSGRFRQAADREKEIAQLYQHELNDLPKACESFEQAGDWYAQEDATAYVYFPFFSFFFFFFCRKLKICCSTANACFKDAAELHGELEEYPQAINLYEQVADHALSSALTKYIVKEYWLRAALCALAMNASFEVMAFAFFI